MGAYFLCGLIVTGSLRQALDDAGLEEEDEAWEALKDCGADPHRLGGRRGGAVGGTTADEQHD